MTTFKDHKTIIYYLLLFLDVTFSPVCCPVECGLKNKEDYQS